MAFHLQNIYGTEQDRVNCPFYFKIGACTYGERCSRLHNKPTESQTVLIMNMYHTPFTQYGPNSEPLFDPKLSQDHLDDFYEDIFLEMAQWGEIEEIYICRNLGDHLKGNCYIKFYEEESAAKGLEACRGRYYSGRPIVAELSPVTDFREARCRQYDIGECNRGGFCNFMHLAEPSHSLHSKLYDWQRKVLRKKRKKERRNGGSGVSKEHDKDKEHEDGTVEREEVMATEKIKEEGHNRERDGGERGERERDRDRGERDRDRERERERDRDRERDRERERERGHSGRDHERDDGRTRRRERDRDDREKDEKEEPDKERDRKRHRGHRSSESTTEPPPNTAPEYQLGSEIHTEGEVKWEPKWEHSGDPSDFPVEMEGNGIYEFNEEPKIKEEKIEESPF